MKTKRSKEEIRNYHEMSRRKSGCWPFFSYDYSPHEENDLARMANADSLMFLRHLTQFSVEGSFDGEPSDSFSCQIPRKHERMDRKEESEEYRKKRLTRTVSSYSDPSSTAFFNFGGFD